MTIGIDFEKWSHAALSERIWDRFYLLGAWTPIIFGRKRYNHG